MTEEIEPSLILLAKRLANRVGRPLGINPFLRPLPYPPSAAIGSRAEVFDSIYHSDFWGSGESRSGIGSEQAFAGAYLTRLQTLIRERGLRRLFDAPCGGLNWSLALARDPTTEYAGGDISAALMISSARRSPSQMPTSISKTTARVPSSRVSSVFGSVQQFPTHFAAEGP